MITPGSLLRRRVAVAFATLGVLAASGCVGPSRSTEDFRHKATSTATAVQGQVAIATLILDNDRRGHSTQNYSSVLLSEVSDDAASMVSAFQTVQPSGAAADALRSELLPILEDTTSALDQARILARRGKTHDIDTSAIKALGDRLGDFVERHDS